MGQIVVEGPDGKKYAFPDTMPREEINAFLRNKYGTKAREETALQYLQRIERERRAPEILKKRTEEQAAAAGRSAGREAQQGAMANPGAYAIAGPSGLLAGREAAAPIYEAGNIVPPDQAFAGGMANAAGLWLPEMLSQPYREGMAAARRDQPGYVTAGDFAGGIGSGEIIGSAIMKTAGMVGPGFRQLGRMIKGKPVAAAADAVTPEEAAFADMVSRIQARTSREEAQRVADEQGLAKAMEMFEPYATPREREMLGLPPRPTAALEDVAPKPKGPYGDGFASPFEELDYVVNTGARADKLTIRQFRDLIESYPPDVVEKYARRMMSAPSGWQMTREDVLDAMQQLYQDSVRQSVKPAGFGASGKVPPVSISPEERAMLTGEAPKGSARTVTAREASEQIADPEYMAARKQAFLSPEEIAMLLDEPKDIKSAGFDVSRPSVRKRTYGSETFNDARLTPDQNKAIEMRRNRYTTREIADEMDTSEDVIYHHYAAARKAGVDIGDATKDNLTVDILTLKEKGIAPKDIAERLGVPRNQVNVMLAQARRRIEKNGSEMPPWLVPGKSPGRPMGSSIGNYAENVFGAGVSSAIGSANPDINGDGVIDETERLIGSGAGLALWASPLALVKAKQLGQMMKSGGR